jgi:carboxynorspermidine decarboxylase
MRGAINGVDTPAFVMDRRRVLEAVGLATSAVAATQCRVLYALKAQAQVDIVRTLCGHVDGLAASSLFEAELARSVMGE